MIKLSRFLALLVSGVLLMMWLSGCGGPTPEERIQLAIDDYREMVMELSDTMSQLRDNTITAQEAQEKLGEEFVKQLTDQETKVRSMIEDFRADIGDGTADAFLFKLDEYRKLGRPTIKDTTREITE